MHRKKTLKKRGFSFKNIPAKELKKSTAVIEHNPTSRLKNKRYVAQALIECLREGDSEAFKEILRSHLDVINKSKFAEKTKISERTLYRMVSKGGNPTLENIARVVHALCA
jgi:probable addiction module antidote protein